MATNYVSGLKSNHQGQGNQRQAGQHQGRGNDRQLANARGHDRQRGNGRDGGNADHDHAGRPKLH